jgi:predicted nucleic acid-binding protein
VAGELLLDTGALVSLLDRSQNHHEACVEWFDGWKGVVVSTEAVLTEATRLLSRVPGGREACIDFFLEGGATLVPSDGSSLRRCRELLRQYRDIAMDFADATLVALGEELGARKVFTLDSDFEVYRLPRRRPFELVPDVPRRGGGAGR